LTHVKPAILPASWTLERAGRLDRFLTQPFHWTEPWTNLPGVHVPLEETLAGCRAIIAGECDDMPDEAFYFIGTLADAREKAKAGNSKRQPEIA
jgi:F-type H+/Na+-transporting ATPase subunit beta